MIPADGACAGMPSDIWHSPIPSYRSRAEFVCGMCDAVGCEQRRPVDVFAAARGPLVERPFPLQPLLAASGESLHTLAVRVRVSGSTICRARDEGCTDEQADRWAVAVGKHPSEVWLDWFDHAGAVEDVPA